MKRIVSVLALVLFAWASLLLAGCPGNPKAEEPAPQKDKPRVETPKPKEPEKKLSDFFPAQKDSVWEYKGEGNEFAGFTRTVLFTKGNLAQMKEDTGGTTSASVYEITDNTITRIYFQGEAYEGNNLLDAKANDDTVILKAPVKVGTKWDYPAGTREIIDTNTIVETPAGRFEKCVKVKLTEQASTMYEYFKGGVGLVKREFISGDTSITSTLEKYTLK